MTQAAQSVKGRKLANFYNMTVNLFWSVTNIGVVFIFVWENYERWLIFLVSGSMIAAIVVPTGLFNRLQASKKAKVYERIGVGVINKLTQNGEWINKLVRKRYPHYRTFERRRSIDALIRQTYMFERFHLAMFLAFAGIAGFAFDRAGWWWAAVICMSNLLYNVYPILLQQYIRLRIRRYRNTDRS